MARPHCNFVVRVFLPRSGSSDPGPRRPRGIAPADGVVSFAGFATPPPELGLGIEQTQRVSIFMSIFDCHVNRAPVQGRVAQIVYHPGLFLNADLDKASEDDERNSIVIDTPSGRFGVVQIAGLVARRIVCFTHEGALLSPGERIGLIRFGSRVDVYLPAGARSWSASIRARSRARR